MPTVTFFGGPMAAPVVCEYLPDGELTVLALARAHGIPIYWRCGRGTCAACATRVTVIEGPLRPLSRREHNVLQREGMSTTLQEAAPNWRLTCYYPLEGETLRVEWE